MNQRERYLETLLFGTPDKVPLEPKSGRISKREAWYTQGLPENNQHGDIPEYGYRQANYVHYIRLLAEATGWL